MRAASSISAFTHLSCIAYFLQVLLVFDANIESETVLDLAASDASSGSQSRGTISKRSTMDPIV
jgi:hypothetical protein